MNIKQTDIIDFVLGQGSPELRQRIESAAASDPEIAAELARWQTVRPALAAERRRAESITESACARVAEKIRDIEPAQARSWSLRQLWRELTRPSVGLTAAACALLIIGAAWFMVGNASHQTSPVVVSSIYVDFGAAREGQGTAHQPFRSLDKGALSVPAGGTLKLMPGATADPVRIAKPMRLTATEGPVRIGKM